MTRLTILTAGLLFVFLLGTLVFSSCTAGTVPSETVDPQAKKVLVFSATKGYRHSSINEGIEALRNLGSSNGFAVVATEDPGIFTEEKLQGFAAIVFLNTTGSFFNDNQKLAFQKYMQRGGGYLGIHSAADTFYDWPWYGELVGGYFESHPEVQMAALKVLDATHPSTQRLPAVWKKRDEWYNFKSLSAKTKVVLSVDEETYRGGKNGPDHPISWYHQFDGGRAFYTALGHTEESYTDPKFLDHIQGALKWIMQEDQ